MMPSTQRKIFWSSTLILGLAFIGVAFFLGFDKADKAAGIIGALLGLMSVAISVYQLWFGSSSQPRTSTGTPAPRRQQQQGGNNSINLQAGNDLTIGDSNKFGKP